ncbi:MAG: hypothetical protein WC648_04185 [Candidatus Paceibacterota bacterium]
MKIEKKYTAYCPQCQAKIEQDMCNCGIWQIDCKEGDLELFYQIKTFTGSDYTGGIDL